MSKQNEILATIEKFLKDRKGPDFQVSSESDLRKDLQADSVDLMDGVADVVVADGFTGNAVLKTMEGTAFGILKQLKQAIATGNWKAKFGAFLLKDRLKSLKQTLDFSDVGGAVLFGLQAPVVKTHGSSDAKAVYSTIRQIRTMLETDVVGKSVKELSKEG